MEINFITQIWQEGKMFVAYAPELDVSSCVKTAQEAQKNLHEAIEIFLEETNKNFYNICKWDRNHLLLI